MSLKKIIKLIITTKPKNLMLKFLRSLLYVRRHIPATESTITVQAPLYITPIDYITPGKVYVGTSLMAPGSADVIYFRIECDNHVHIWCSSKNCAHIECDWIIINHKIIDYDKNSEIQRFV